MINSAICSWYLLSNDCLSIGLNNRVFKCSIIIIFSETNLFVSIFQFLFGHVIRKVAYITEYLFKEVQMEDPPTKYPIGLEINGLYWSQIPKPKSNKCFLLKEKKTWNVIQCDRFMSKLLSTQHIVVLVLHTSCHRWTNFQ